MAAEVQDINSGELMNKYLECSVCLEQFTKPKMLPCQHTFCLKCLKGMAVKKKMGIVALLCPLCKAPTPLPGGKVDNFPSNFLVSSLLQYALSAQTDTLEQQECKLRYVDLSSSLDNTQCNICEVSSDLATFCNTCTMWICDTCTNHHKKIPSTSDHKLFSNADVLRETKKIAGDWQHYMDDLKARMNTRLNSLKQDMHAQLREKNEACSMVKSTADVFKKVIDDKCTELLAELENSYLVKKQVTQGRVSDIKGCIEEIKKKDLNLSAICKSDSGRCNQRDIQSVVSFFLGKYAFENDHKRRVAKESKGKEEADQEVKTGESEHSEAKRLALRGDTFIDQRDVLTFKSYEAQLLKLTKAGIGQVVVKPAAVDDDAYHGLTYSANRSYAFISSCKIKGICKIKDKGQDGIESDQFFVQNLPWYVKAVADGDDLGLYVYCDGDEWAQSNTWSCRASIWIYLYKNKKLDYLCKGGREAKYVYNTDNTGWGFQFISLKDVLNRTKGFICNDTIDVAVAVSADLAQGVKRHIKVGTKVVRGSDWMWGCQDGQGQGTVTEVEGSAGQGWCRVKWDHDMDSSNTDYNRYRIGADDKFDLRVLK